MNPEPLSFVPKPPPPIKRPGVNVETLAAARIRRVTAAEAQVLVGEAASGIIIPYHALDGQPIHRDSDGSQPFCRLRLNSPVGSKKYTQRTGTKPALYIPPALGSLLQTRLVEGRGKIGSLYLCEGEFKCLCAVESGIIAAGIGGITSAIVGGDLVHGLRDLITDWGFDRVVLIGDADIGVNYDFARAGVALAKAMPEDVDFAVIAPGLNAPAKGLDDQREKLGDKFPDYWASLVANVVSVPRELTTDELALALLRREDAATIRAIYRSEFSEEAAA